MAEYLESSCHEIEEDTMRIWASLENRFSQLYKIAVKYIHLLGSSVPSERLFSHCGKIKSDERAQLSGEYLNKCHIFLN